MAADMEKEKSLNEKYPYLHEYKSCQRGAFKKGVYAMCASFAGVYVAQEMMWSKLPYGKDKFLFAPIWAGIVMSYYISGRETLKCKRRWMDLVESDDSMSHYQETDNSNTEYNQGYR